jgi:hypothetical protein
MNDSDNIKALIPVICPHCSKTLVVEFLINANLLTPEAAEEVLKDIYPLYQVGEDGKVEKVDEGEVKEKIHESKEETEEGTS